MRNPLAYTKLKLFMAIAVAFLGLYSVYRYYAPHPKATGVHSNRSASHDDLHAVQMTTQVVDGSKTPELIPDYKAFHVVLLSASPDDIAPNSAKLRALAVISNLGLVGTDSIGLSDIAKRYRSAFNLSRGQRFADDVLFEQARQTSVSSFVAEIESKLSPLGIAKVEGYVQSAKKNIKLYPLPSMTRSVAELRRFFPALVSVHAQGMSPSGAVYSQVSVDNSGNNYIYGLSITDATSSCQCHNSTAQANLTISGGGSINSGVSGGGEYAEAQASYQLTDSDFDVSQDGEVDIQGLHNSYCPIAIYEFINAQTSSTSAPLRRHHAYYSYKGNLVYTRCNPIGTICDNLAVVATFHGLPSYALLWTTEINIDFSNTHVCLGALDSIVDKCYGVDPRP